MIKVKKKKNILDEDKKSQVSKYKLLTYTILVLYYYIIDQAQ